MSQVDDALITRATRGDQAAFDQLVRRHTPRMYRVALRIVGSSAEAEDIVQDSWISAWRSLTGFRHESTVSTWLYRVVTNTALGHIRRRKQTISLESAFGDDEDQGRSLLESGIIADARSDPEHTVVTAQQIEHVLRAIATLDMSQRVPLVLKELEGLSYEEVAEVLGVNVAALRSRLHRARVALLAKLREPQ